jgi:4-amino-4-deoxy-L-arabinose transferase-like glycosyltransferase
VLAVIITHALARKLDHDEEQFVSAGALLLRAGLLPYRDYPFFHLPNLPLIFAALFSTNGYLLLTARCFDVACAGLLLVLIFMEAARRLRPLCSNYLSIAAGCVLILAFDPFFRFTAGRAWNHDLPVLATFVSLFALLRGLEGTRAVAWFFCCGVALGLAIGTRLTFAPLAAGFPLALFLASPPTASRTKNIAVFGGGLIVALGPTIAFFVAWPHQFIFDNFTYNGALNHVYRQATIPAKITFVHKASFMLKGLAKSPSSLALIAGFLYFCIRPSLRARWRHTTTRPEILSISLIVPLLLIGAFAPTPSHRQYFYALIPFVLLGNIYGIAHARLSPRIINRSVNLLLVLTFAQSTESFVRDKSMFNPSRWGAITAHRGGVSLRQIVQTGPVLTLNPIYPLEGELTIYKELAVGPFAWRTAAFLDEADETRFDMLDPDDLEAFLEAHPPTAFLTQLRPQPDEEALLDYLHRHAYTPRTLNGARILWLHNNQIQNTTTKAELIDTAGGAAALANIKRLTR